ncbi:NAD(P)-dependent alcohol dehydrogenase [Sphingomonas koreensis]|uniref:NAD(P)-dependent alcohol dehydrogenase n=1 Tax=Sphingomonas koreensis TaxID=93064 RepID=A0A430G1T3_9SPHN|nr:NAD(P)-dependent alcohol dehydrogenase [Sphingomonas koreensis]RSY82014.1 NAD(P)-dependent alcohol dehydrogenase [Sphingomonas koreensis]
MRRYIIDPAVGLRLDTTSASPTPAPDEVVVQVRAVSLNFRDHLIATGSYPLPVKSELVPVSDGAGEIVQIGHAVTQFRVGDPVVSMFFPEWQGGGIAAHKVGSALGGTTDGMLSEQVVLPSSALAPFPPHLSFEQAATLPCAGVTAWNAIVEVGRVAEGDVVLLQGTGGVSTFALQFAKLAGATVIQTSSSDEKLAAARALGADHLVNYQDTPDWDVEARRLTDGRGVDLVVDIGGAATLERSLRSVRLGGRVAAVGLVGGLGMIDPLPILTGVVNISGVLVGSREMYTAMAQAIAAAGIEPIIDRSFSFEDAPAAFAYLAAGAAGKIVIRI